MKIAMERVEWRENELSKKTLPTAGPEESHGVTSLPEVGSESVWISFPIRDLLRQFQSRRLKMSLVSWGELVKDIKPK